jgi:cytochrome c-type biogenesis protein CcmH/NrfG
VLFGIFLAGFLIWAQLTDGGNRATEGSRAWLFMTTGLDLRIPPENAVPPVTPRPSPSAFVAASPQPSIAPASPAATAEASSTAVVVAPSPAPSAAPSETPAAPVSPVASPVVAVASPAPTRAPHLSVDQLLQQGYDAYQKGKYAEAIRKYQTAVNAAPDNSEAYALLGLAYLDGGQDDLAESSLEASIRLNARFADSHRYLGLLYSRRGDKTRAVAEFNIYLDLRPTGPTSDDVRKRVASLQGG